MNSKELEIGGVILAGGNANRLGGCAKGVIQVSKGFSIVEKLINEFLKTGIDTIVIAANDPAPYLHFGVEVISDIRPGIGPMGGIESGLMHFTGRFDAVMFVPCDMPNITCREMSALKKAFIENKKPVVFAQTAGFFWHPLCTVVHSNIREQISSVIDSGQRKVQDIWRKLDVIKVQFDDEAAFFNINSFTDLDKWEIRNRNEKTNMCGNIDSTAATRVRR